MPILTQALALSDLPAPPPGRTGWPWTELSSPLPPRQPDGSPWPLLSIVTPSYNQAEFLEATIRSVLLQGYPNLEYLLLDGGSTDGSFAIIQKYAPFLAFWVSERDRGQSHALNKGFARATGDLIGWQNSDDTYEPNAFASAARTWLANPDAGAVYGGVNYVDIAHRFLAKYPVCQPTVATTIPFASVTNHSVFYAAKVLQAGERIDETLQHCMDQEFHLRLLLKGYHFQFAPGIAANWRIHPAAKSTRQMEVWAYEAFQLCKLVYQREDLAPAVRQHARNSLYGLCLDNFAKGRVVLFRQTVRELIELWGWRGLAPQLWWKYALSWLGASNVRYLLALKSRLKLLRS
ncbi:MAG: glycosyltransferase [Spirulinaceae cyanobacterium RM2_2_10]|nr:glycosyltransferase [Spirulinaceae cyanobacterium SM2_1_0]NJO19045.1 glycosyltransferase [Spirulinaceae cyanobacterium RM2_2_10]